MKIFHHGATGHTEPFDVFLRASVVIYRVGGLALHLWDGLSAAAGATCLLLRSAFAQVKASGGLRGDADAVLDLLAGDFWRGVEQGCQEFGRLWVLQPGQCAVGLAYAAQISECLTEYGRNEPAAERAHLFVLVVGRVVAAACQIAGRRVNGV